MSHLQDFILEAIHAGLIDPFEAWRTMAILRAIEISEGRDPWALQVRWGCWVEQANISEKGA